MAGKSLFIHHLYNFPLGVQDVKTNNIKKIIVNNFKLNLISSVLKNIDSVVIKLSFIYNLKNKFSKFLCTTFREQIEEFFPHFTTNSKL